MTLDEFLKPKFKVLFDRNVYCIKIKRWYMPFYQWVCIPNSVNESGGEIIRSFNSYSDADKYIRDGLPITKQWQEVFGYDA